MEPVKVRKSLAILPFIVLAGCSGGAGSGKLVPVKGPSGATNTDAPGAILAAPTNKTNTPKEPIEMKLAFASGRREVYALMNEILLETTVGKQVFHDSSYINAEQSVNVIKPKPDGATVSIVTSNVSAGVRGAGQVQAIANDWLKKVSSDIEGSVMQGDYDARGRGTGLQLFGDGVGLNPMGPQVGSQNVMVGFMGILFPKGPTRVGDTWQGTFDFTKSGEDLFAQQGGRVENGEVPITYKLLDYDKARGTMTLGLECKGKPLVKVPMEGAVSKINLDVESHGQALVRMSDGWLQELRLETTVMTDGGGLLYPMKHTIRTVTRLKGR